MYAMYRYIVVNDTNIVSSFFPLLSIVPGLQPTEVAASVLLRRPVFEVVETLIAKVHRGTIDTEHFS